MIWNGTAEKLILFIDELNKKHKTKKIDYKISTKQIEFLDTVVYRYQQHKIQNSDNDIPQTNGPTNILTCTIELSQIS